MGKYKAQILQTRKQKRHPRQDIADGVMLRGHICIRQLKLPVKPT
jgi:hypothetical protein